MWAVFENLVSTAPITDFIKKSKDCSSKIENAGKIRAKFINVHHFFNMACLIIAFLSFCHTCKMRAYNEIQKFYDFLSFLYVFFWVYIQ